MVFVMTAIQAYLWDIAGSVPGHHNWTGLILFAGGESSLQFVKNTMSVQHNKAKCNKARYASR